MNIALIGDGYWGSKLRRYILEHPKITLCDVCNSKSDLTNIWNNTDIGSVVIATRNESHYRIAKEALENGKNVFCEKPLAFKKSQCEELCKLADQRKLKLAVEYTFTFSKSIKAMANLIRKNTIGELLGIYMTVKHLGRFGGGNVYWLLGSHLLSVLDIFTPLENTKFTRKDIVTRNNQVETGSILFRNKRLSGEILVSLNHPDKEINITLYGENGTIIYNPLLPPSVRVVTYNHIIWDTNITVTTQSYSIDESNNLRHAIDYFYNLIMGKSSANGALATKVTGILEGLCQK